ncbi:MAG: AbgT family transporter [Bacteroidales bacterium]|nr:AbgT family transporter [Bacteroidales bacterium]
MKAQKRIKGKVKIPHTFVIICSMILLCGVMTWFVPAGQFDHQQVVVNGSSRDVIVPGSYHAVEQAPQTWQIFGAFLKGFQMQAAIIAFVLIIGGAFQIMNSSKAIDFGIMAFLRKSKQWESKGLVRKIGVGPIVITVTMVIFSLFGAIFGMSEETLAFVIIFVPLAISMGYDSITGLLMVYVAAHIGFSGAIFNPFTIGIAQGLSGIPLFSGFEYRTVIWLVLTALIIGFTLFYAAKVKKNPKASPMYELDAFWRNRREEAAEAHFDYETPRAAWVTFALVNIVLILFSVFYPMTTMTVGESSFTFPWVPVLTALHALLGFFLLRKSCLYYVLEILLFTILFLVVGVLGHGWYVMEISALFLAMGIISGFAMGANASKVALEFIAGAKDIITAAIIVGLAGGIIIVLQDGHIMDTILYALAGTMEGSGKGTTASLMYLIQTCLNLFIPSGTAKAALTMPIMAPFSDIVELSRQTTVLAYQLGDGFTNMITPTSAVLMGALGIAKVPYDIWFKWWWKILLCFMILGLAFLLVTVMVPLNGF